MPVLRFDADPFYIPKPDGSRHYRWIADDPRRMALWLRSVGEAPGYSLVQGPTVPETIKVCEALGLPEQLVDKSRNVIRVGFNILASIPIEEHVLRQEYLMRQSNDALSTAEDNFLGVADGLPGVRGFKENTEEFEERKKVTTRPDRPFAGQVGGSAQKRGTPSSD